MTILSLLTSSKVLDLFGKLCDKFGGSLFERKTVRGQVLYCLIRPRNIHQLRQAVREFVGFVQKHGKELPTNIAMDFVMEPFQEARWSELYIEYNRAKKEYNINAHAVTELPEGEGWVYELGDIESKISAESQTHLFGKEFEIKTHGWIGIHGDYPTSFECDAQGTAWTNIESEENDKEEPSFITTVAEKVLEAAISEAKRAAELFTIRLEE